MQQCTGIEEFTKFQKYVDQIVISFNKREQELIARVNHLEQFIEKQDKQLAKDFRSIDERFCKLESHLKNTVKIEKTLFPAKDLHEALQKELKKNISQQHLEKKLAEKNEHIKQLEKSLAETQKASSHWFDECNKLVNKIKAHPACTCNPSWRNCT